MTTPQPAALPELPDDELRKAIDALRDPNTVSAFHNGDYTLTPDELRRAILALRPAQQATPEPVGEPYGWVYTNSQGARVLHLEPSARLDADKQAAATWPNHHKCIPVYTHAPQQVPMNRYAAYWASPVCSEWEASDAYMQGIADAEAHHGITAQAKGEQA